MRWPERYLADSPAALRRLVLLLYALVLPPFVAVLAIAAPPETRWTQVAAVMGICAIGGGWIAYRRRPGRHSFLFTSGIAPVLSCGIAFAATDPHGHAFFGVLGAPVAWAAALFEGATVFAAWGTATATCFVLSTRESPVPIAAANALVFGVIQALVVAVVHGRSASYREARLRSLERHLNDIELMMKTDGALVLANDRAVDAYGWSRDELLRMSIRDLRLGEPTEVRAQMEDVLRNGALVFEAEHRRRDGSTFPVEVSSRLCEVGAERYLHSVIRDITVKRRHDDALRDALAAEKRFLAAMSHEIRTPLNGVVGFLDLLAGEELEGPRRGWVDKAQISARHLMALINDILDVSKLDAGQVELASEPIELGPLLGECLAMASPRVPPGVELGLAAPPPPQRLTGDGTRVRQIVVNLLANAARFTERGHIQVGATVDEQGDGRARVIILVEDTGVGIPKEQLATLFQQFRQAHGARYGGTGLGLFLSRALARLMGGDVSVESEVGVGTRVRVELDLPLAPPAPAARSNLEGGAERPSQPEMRSMRVLVVDDVPLNVALVVEMLRRHPGVEVETAGDGAVAVELASAKAFDLVLMDLQMPLVDGIEATRRIRALGLATPIVAITASAMGDEIDAALAAGMNGFLSKPIRRADVARVLAAHQPPPAAPPPAEPPAPAAPSLRDRARRFLSEDLPAELVPQIIDTVATTLTTSRADLAKARAEGDMRATSRALHKIRGTLLNCGLDDLAAAAGSLEHAADLDQQGARIDALDAALARF